MSALRHISQCLVRRVHKANATAIAVVAVVAVVKVSKSSFIFNLSDFSFTT